VNTDGSLNNNNANNSYGVLADCVPFPRLHQADRERVRL
jgi:hypothetical protein